MNLAVVDWGGIPDGILFPVGQRWFETKRVLLFVNNVAWRAPILKVTMPYLPQYREDPFTVAHTVLCHAYCSHNRVEFHTIFLEVQFLARHSVTKEYPFLSITRYNSPRAVAFGSGPKKA